MIRFHLAFRTVLFCTLLGIILTSVGCRSASRNKLENARINSIIINSRAYASDNNGAYPTKLDDLYPKYINLVSNFYSPPQNEAEPDPQPYYYRPGLQVSSAVDEPIVVSPHVIKGKVNVGYRGGAIRRMSYEDAQKVLSLPGWIRTAPSMVSSSK